HPYSVIDIARCCCAGQLDTLGLVQLHTCRPVGIRREIVGEDVAALNQQAAVPTAYHRAPAFEEICVDAAPHPNSNPGWRIAAGTGDGALRAVQDHETRG